MVSFTEAYEAFKQNMRVFVIGVIVGASAVIGVLKFLDFFYSGKEVSRDYVPKEKFTELEEKYTNSQNLQSQLGQFKTNTGELKTKLEACQTQNTEISNSLLLANIKIKKSNQVEKLMKQNEDIWRKIERLNGPASNWDIHAVVGGDYTASKLKKIEGFKIQSEQLQQQINILLGCTNSS